MAFEQLPGALGLKFRRGDSVSTEIDFNPISLVGLGVTATLVSVTSGATVTSAAVTMVDAAAGRVNVGLTKTQTAALPAGTYRWTLIAGDGTAQRTYLAGFVEAVG